MTDSRPGTAQHQEILSTIINYYADDPRILAVLIFGSLGRGNWDQYSDLDMDIVTAADVVTDARIELKQLCGAIKAQHGLDAIIIADIEEGDVVLTNLAEFSIRYHPLHDTKPAILDSMILLDGQLSLEQIRIAGEANRSKYQQVQPGQEDIVNSCVRYALEIHNAIKRNRLWMCLELLHRVRSLLMLSFAIRYKAERPMQYFEAHAPSELQSQLKQLVSELDIASVKAALTILIDLLRQHKNGFFADDDTLTEQQAIILEQLSLTL